jgi:regulatory protein RepA
MKIRCLDIQKTLSNPAPSLQFVLPGLMPGHAGIVVGRGGVGKSNLLLQLAMSYAAGIAAVDDVFPRPPTPLRVLYLAAEESDAILANRIHAVHDWLNANSSTRLGNANTDERFDAWTRNLLVVPGAGLDVRLISEGTTTPFYDAFRNLAKSAQLVLVDPLRRLHDGDENSSAAMTQMVQVLECIAQQSGAAVIAAHHINKSANSFGTEGEAGAARGSSALTDGVRWQLNVSGMSASEAKALGIAGQQSSYVRLDFAKANYLPPQPTFWMKRTDGGVLEKVHFEKPTTGKTSQRRGKTAAAAGEEFIYV